jgi:hypothetical protein
MATTKLGALIPRAQTESTKSPILELGDKARARPIAIPKRVAKNIATVARIKVAGRASLMDPVTGLSVI